MKDFLNIYLIGIALALILTFVAETAYGYDLRKDIERDIPDLKEDEKMLEVLDYIMIGMLSWVSVVGVLHDLVSYYNSKRREQ